MLFSRWRNSFLFCLFHEKYLSTIVQRITFHYAKKTWESVINILLAGRLLYDNCSVIWVGSSNVSGMGHTYISHIKIKATCITVYI